MRGYALRAAELASAAAGLATSVVLLIAGCALLGVAAAGGGGAVVAIVIAVVLVAAVFARCDQHDGDPDPDGRASRAGRRDPEESAACDQQDHRCR